MINEQTIPCPVCQSKIIFEPNALLRGVQFACPSCYALVGIAKESIDEAKDAMEKFNELKQQANKIKKPSLD